MIGRGFAAMVVWGFWCVLALAAISYIARGLRAETVFQQNSLYAGVLLLGVLGCYALLASMAEQRRKADEQFRRLLVDIALGSLREENREQHDRRVRARREKEAEDARLYNFLIISLIVAMVGGGALFIAYATSH